MKADKLNRRPIFAGFMMTYFSFGTLFYAHGFYLAQLTQLHDWSASLVSGGVSSFWLAAAAAGLLVGWRIDTGDPRWVAVYGAVTLGVCMFALGLLDKPWQLYVVYTLLGTTYPALATPAVSGALTRWFDRRYGVALSFAMTGASIGGIISVPLLVCLAQRFSFSIATAVIGVIALVFLVPAILWGFREPPPRRSRIEEKNTSHPALVLFRAPFWFVALGFGLGFSAQVGFITHQLSLLITRTSPETAAGIVSLTVISSMGGRFLVGYLSDLFPVRLLAVCSICILSAGIFLAAFTDSVMHAVAGSIVVGFALAANTMLSPMVTRHDFGDACFGRIFSYATVVLYAGMGLGPWIAGYLLDATGNYRTPLLCLAALGLTGAVILLTGGYAASGRPSQHSIQS